MQYNFIIFMEFCIIKYILWRYNLIDEITDPEINPKRVLIDAYLYEDHDRFNNIKSFLHSNVKID